MSFSSESTVLIFATFGPVEISDYSKSTQLNNEI